MEGTLRRITTISKMKLKANFANKTAMISPFFALGIMLVIQLVIKLNGVTELPDVLKGQMLYIAIFMNLSMTGVVSTGTLLSEEKEKHTLRSLMTSSVSGVEFFAGSLAPNVLVMMVINFLLLFVSEISLNQINIPCFILITLVGSVISAVLGMLVGIFSKNQMSASILTLPVILVLGGISFVGQIFPAATRVSQYFFLEMLSKMCSAFALNQNYALSFLGLIALALQLVIVILLFFVAYKRNGYEKD